MEVSKLMKLKFTYDQEADAAYVSLGDTKAGEIANTYPIEQFKDADINFDIDAEGRLRGIEILGASDLLRLDAR